MATAPIWACVESKTHDVPLAAAAGVADVTEAAVAANAANAPAIARQRGKDVRDGCLLGQGTRSEVGGVPIRCTRGAHPGQDRPPDGRPKPSPSKAPVRHPMRCHTDSRSSPERPM